MDNMSLWLRSNILHYPCKKVYQMAKQARSMFRHTSRLRVIKTRSYTANVLPTAEGAIQIALEEMPITLHGARVLVIGYGRVGKLTAHRFAALGAKVSVSARKFEDLAWAEAMGYGVEQTGSLVGWLCAYDLVVNTVPARVLSEKELKDLKPGCLVIDLASKPGGVGLRFG